MRSVATHLPGRDVSFIPRYLTVCACLALCLAAGTSTTWALGKTVLVYAPHPDDESLFAAGVIYRARLAGNIVKVVLATNGDYNGRGIGSLRQGESVEALKLLRLTEDDVIFLGYEDGALMDFYLGEPDAIVAAKWGTQTYGDRGYKRKDYHRAKNGVPGEYSRRTLLGDIVDTMKEFSPDEIYTVLHYDAHPDHRALSMFVKEAILLARGSIPAPVLFESLVWAPEEFNGNPHRWPWPPFAPNLPMAEPDNLYQTPFLWEQIHNSAVPYSMLDPDQNRNLKNRAISVYASQHGNNKSDWLFSFVKKNEFFWRKDYGINLAPWATVACSSENPEDGQLAAKAVDGIVAGYLQFRPELYTKEWVAPGSANPWIELRWPNPVRIGHVVLYDRPNLDDNVLEGLLRFSDNSIVPVPSLPPDGTPLSITFAARNVTSLRFEVLSSAGSNIGLAEFEALGKPAGDSQNNEPYFSRGPVAAPGEIDVTQTSNIAVTAHDVDGDSLRYSWIADGGTIASAGASAVFRPPSSISAPQVFTITATVSDGRGGSAANSTFITVNPGPPTVKFSLSLKPSAVREGSASVGTISLDKPAPAGGFVAEIENGNRMILDAPEQVTLAAGSRSATFDIGTKALRDPVTGLTPPEVRVFLSVGIGASVKKSDLIVVAVSVNKLELERASVDGGKATAGTVKLNSAAPPGGLLVKLSCDKPDLVSVPESVTVPEGATSAKFGIQTKDVRKKTDVWIAASGGGQLKRAQLEVK